MAMVFTSLVEGPTEQFRCLWVYSAELQLILKVTIVLKHWSEHRPFVSARRCLIGTRIRPMLATGAGIRGTVIFYTLENGKSGPSRLVCIVTFAFEFVPCAGSQSPINPATRARLPAGPVPPSWPSARSTGKAETRKHGFPLVRRGGFWLPCLPQACLC
ncbi:hypothetical protein LZ30DRAFT_186040 [Colletotrichum cereale]|nr:hypothetical protein LZ30DRAFT_186040 [Colletotrichum cereale]